MPLAAYSRPKNEKGCALSGKHRLRNTPCRLRPKRIETYTYGTQRGYSSTLGQIVWGKYPF